MSAAIQIFGIRHHGPGCARQLVNALEELRPDAILLEAPADVEAALAVAGAEGFRPPVGMLVYVKDQPQRSVVYPLAEYSPEWQAIRWGLRNQVPVIPMDLPISMQFQKQEGDENNHSAFQFDANPQPWRADPISILAESAGYADPEQWWDEQIERRVDARGLFEAIQLAMTAIRDELGDANTRDLAREAFMRQTIRKSLKDGATNIAIVCGAWHGPVLHDAAISGKVPGLKPKDDSARLKGLPKTKTVATWIPWSNTRLCSFSGYGAGIPAPSWYQNLWAHPKDSTERWLVNAARLLREFRTSTSPASVIEAKRLAETLAAMRGRSAVGLSEINEAILTVFCHGDGSELPRIQRQLEVGFVLGQVPADTPLVPLEADVKRLLKSLRLPLSEAPKTLVLDLRKDNGLERSQFLYRLNLLNIPWGELVSSGGQQSTFREEWSLKWDPEFSITLIDANVWGNTVEEAVNNKTQSRVAASADLSELVTMLEACLHAALPRLFPVLSDRIQQISAVSSDLMVLARSVPPLSRISRYGDVRQSNELHLAELIQGISTRVIAGMLPASLNVDDEFVEEQLNVFDEFQKSLQLMSLTDLLDEWYVKLKLMQEGQTHPQLKGWAARTLLDHGLIDELELDRLARFVFSDKANPMRPAQWLQGVLRGPFLQILTQDKLWRVIDRWMSELEGELFLEILPLLRRAFSDFSKAERRDISLALGRLQASAGANQAAEMSSTAAAYDLERASLVIPVLSEILAPFLKDVEASSISSVSKV